MYKYSVKPTLNIRVYYYGKCEDASDDIYPLTGKMGHDIIRQYLYYSGIRDEFDKLDSYVVKWDVQFRDIPETVKGWYLYQPFGVCPGNFSIFTLPDSFFTLQEFGSEIDENGCVEDTEIYLPEENEILSSANKLTFFRDMEVTVFNINTFICQPMSSLNEKTIRHNRKKVIKCINNGIISPSDIYYGLAASDQNKFSSLAELKFDKKSFIFMFHIIDNFRFSWEPKTPHLIKLAEDIKDLAYADLLITYPFKNESKGCSAELSLAAIYKIPAVVVDSDDFNSEEFDDSRNDNPVICSNQLFLFGIENPRPRKLIGGNYNFYLNSCKKKLIEENNLVDSISQLEDLLCKK